MSINNSSLIGIYGLKYIILLVGSIVIPSSTLVCISELKEIYNLERMFKFAKEDKRKEIQQKLILLEEELKNTSEEK